MSYSRQSDSASYETLKSTQVIKSFFSTGRYASLCGKAFTTAARLNDIISEYRENL
jgi:hypothetical protein